MKIGYQTLPNNCAYNCAANCAANCDPNCAANCKSIAPPPASPQPLCTTLQLKWQAVALAVWRARGASPFNIDGVFGAETGGASITSC